MGQPISYLTGGADESGHENATEPSSSNLSKSQTKIKYSWRRAQQEQLTHLKQIQSYLSDEQQDNMELLGRAGYKILLKLKITTYDFR